MGSFSPYGGFPGGVNVGVGDVDGDTIDEIVTAAGAGGGPHVIVWDWTNGARRRRSTAGTPYDAGFKGGVNVSVADVVGSTKDDVVTAPGAGGGPHVHRVGSRQRQRRCETRSGSRTRRRSPAACSVGAGEIDGARAVVTGAGPGGGPHVRLFTTNGALKSEFFAYAADYPGGVNVI